MIEITKISKNSEDYYSYEDFTNKCRNTIVNSYDEYIKNNHNWCWCLIGNIVEQHEYGEEHEMKCGTKQFSKGTKVYLAPAQWGDGYEKIVVIGMARSTKRYIEVITKSKYVENLRIQKVFKSAVLRKICDSQYRWWGDTESDRSEIIGYLESCSPELAEKERK